MNCLNHLLEITPASSWKWPYCPFVPCNHLSTLSKAFACKDRLFLLHWLHKIQLKSYWRIWHLQCRTMCENKIPNKLHILESINSICIYLILYKHFLILSWVTVSYTTGVTIYLIMPINIDLRFKGLIQIKQNKWQKHRVCTTVKFSLEVQIMSAQDFWSFKFM